MSTFSLGTVGWSTKLMSGCMLKYCVYVFLVFSICFLLDSCFFSLSFLFPLPPLSFSLYPPQKSLGILGSSRSHNPPAWAYWVRRLQAGFTQMHSLLSTEVFGPSCLGSTGYFYFLNWSSFCCHDPMCCPFLISLSSTVLALSWLLLQINFSLCL